MGKKLTQRKISNLQCLFILSPVLWAITTARWGSYLPREPFFFNDAFIVMAFLAAAKLRVLKIQKISFTRFVIYAFVFWILIRASFSLKKIDLNTIRDFAPYAYFLYIFPLRKLWTNIDSGQRKKIENWLIKAFIIHFLWVFFAYILSFTSINLPYINESQQIRIFTIRPDFDAVIMTVTAYLAAIKLVSKKKIMNGIVAVICLIFIVSQGNRSSFISLMIILLIFLFKNIRKSTSIERSILILIFSTITISIALVIISNTEVGKKFSGTFLVFNSQKELMSNIDGFGTANARLESWQRVLSYMNESPAKQLVGVGFGRDFMTESGALRALVASEQGSRALPRQPHNYALNTYSRLGFTGFVFYLFAFTRVLGESFRQIHKDVSPLTLIGSLMFITLLPISLLGVVSESPFGAISTIFGLSLLLERIEFYERK